MVQSVFHTVIKGALRLAQALDAVGNRGYAPVLLLKSKFTFCEMVSLLCPAASRIKSRKLQYLSR
jgi:hypothetical protein